MITLKAIDIKTLMRRPDLLLAFGFGTGLSPKAPGTMGTVAAIPLVYWLHNLTLIGYLSVLFVGFVLGIWLCRQAMDYLGTVDPAAVVWDEMIGFGIAMIAVPMGVVEILLAFVLFRLFDIWKPWPIRWCDRQLHGGFGVMFDDVLAGLMACGVLHGLLWLG